MRKHVPSAYMHTCHPSDPAYVECDHKRSVLSDILELLEIA
jgi:hypothetical protein